MKAPIKIKENVEFPYNFEDNDLSTNERLTLKVFYSKLETDAIPLEKRKFSEESSMHSSPPFQKKEKRKM